VLTSAYSIYVHKRPQRVAFLVDGKPESMPIVDAILEHNRDRWGGRYNPLVVTDGQLYEPLEVRMSKLRIAPEENQNRVSTRPTCPPHVKRRRQDCQPFVLKATRRIITIRTSGIFYEVRRDASIDFADLAAALLERRPIRLVPVKLLFEQWRDGPSIAAHMERLKRVYGPPDDSDGYLSTHHRLTEGVPRLL
jgi:hypothetical protein